MFNNGIKQAQNLGIDVLEEEIIDIKPEEDSCFEVKSTSHNYETKSVIIATGNKKVNPNIKGIKEFEGKGVSYCAICDGFFYKDKKVAVIGNGEFALNEANDLSNLVDKLVILTNGKEKLNTDKYLIDTRIIEGIYGNDKVEYIQFEDGEKIAIDGVFIAEGIAGGSSFAKKLGIISNEDSIIVDENMQTNINGVFACGNVTGGLLQVSKAVYEGAKAGLSVVQYIKSINK